MPKFIVCPECEGEGYRGTLGAFTPGELGEWYDDADEYESAHEASIERCNFCAGSRVVTESRVEEYEEYLTYEAEKRAEYRYFGGNY